jgi:hypothetical protein
MKILLISTLAHNPGDEIIRLGLEHVLGQVFPGAEFTVIHKHDPRTLFAGFKQRRRSPRRLISPLLYFLFASTYGRGRLNHLEDADLVVFAGTPFIWRGDVRFLRFTSANAEWVPATWQRLFDEFPDKPVMNLAAGSFIHKGQRDKICADPMLTRFLEKAVRRCLLTTARDAETQDILAELGFQIQLIPCSSILAAHGAHLTAQHPEYVVINLMRAAGTLVRGRHGETLKWRETIEFVVPEIEKRNSVLFVSHSQNDDDVVAEWFPQHRRFFSKNPFELLKVYSKALYGLCNRVHSGGAIASFARPVIVVGGDSRINLIKQFGMPTVDHREIDGPGLLAMVQHMERNYDGYVSKLREVISSAEREYISAIRNSGLVDLSSLAALGRP